MKKRVSFLVACILLLTVCLGMLPIGAAEGEMADWEKISYRTVEGGDVVELNKNSPRVEIKQAIELDFDPNKSIVEMNLEPIEPGHRIEVAGSYRVKVYDKSMYVEGSSQNSATIYVVIYQPQLVMMNGEKEVALNQGGAYQFYPSFICDNASSIKLWYGINSVDYVSGEPWPEDFSKNFGEFKLEIYGYNYNKHAEIIKTVTFKIHPCISSQGFDSELGLHALKITIGTFDGVKIMIDGERELKAGETAVITAVGQHVLDLYFGDAKQDPELHSAYGMPKAKDLALRIDVELESAVWDAPRSLDFSRWDAKILLDGSPVSGEFRIDKSGDHVIVAVDADGNEIAGAFSIKTGDAEPVVQDSVSVTFDNPHNLYFWFILIPVILVLVAAIGFLILRRSIK